MNRLPVAPAHTLAERAEEQRWLVDRLWSEEAVGIIGGEPKCCKSFLALDLAVSIAAGTPCLRRFAVQRPGRVLLYAAEDALHIVRRRLDGICAAAGRDLADLDVQVITAPSLRLDLDADRASLDETVACVHRSRGTDAAACVVRRPPGPRVYRAVRSGPARRATRAPWRCWRRGCRWPAARSGGCGGSPSAARASGTGG